MARIVTVYADRKAPWEASDMSFIRWLKISQALAKLGHHVDMATAERVLSRRWWAKSSVAMGPRLRRVPLARVDWPAYDVVKTLFHKGFQTLENFGGGDHPFIISKLGSVVGPTDMPGIYFYGPLRERLFSLQEKIAAASRFVTVLSPQAMALWKETTSHRDNVLLVPGAVDQDIRAPGPDPYPAGAARRCIFAGNIYQRNVQPEANEVLVRKLNGLGERVSGEGVRVFFLGTGETGNLDDRYVTHLGAAQYDDSWAYLLHAHVGTVVAAGEFMHNNESTKIYHYLRAGLPVVSEAGFPNDHVVEESGLGRVIQNGNLDAMAGAIVEAAHGTWDRETGIDYVLRNHTWDARVRVYDSVIAEHLGRGTAGAEA